MTHPPVTATPGTTRYASDRYHALVRLKCGFYERSYRLSSAGFRSEYMANQAAKRLATPETVGRFKEKFLDYIEQEEARDHA